MKTPEELAREIDCHSDECPTLDLDSNKKCNCELIPKLARAIRLGQVELLRKIADTIEANQSDIDKDTFGSLTVGAPLTKKEVR